MPLPEPCPKSSNTNFVTCIMNNKPQKPWWTDGRIYLNHLYHYFTSAGCMQPTPPSRGSIDNFQSAAEGATITYRCSPGLVPGTQMSAVCTNMTWRPASLQCREPGELWLVIIRQLEHLETWLIVFINGAWQEFQFLSVKYITCYLGNI